MNNFEYFEKKKNETKLEIFDYNFFGHNCMFRCRLLKQLICLRSLGVRRLFGSSLNTYTYVHMLCLSSALP